MHYYRSVLVLITFLFSACTSINVYKNPLNELSTSVTRTKVAIDIIQSEVYTTTARNRALNAAIESERFGENDLEPIISTKYNKIRIYGLHLIEELCTRLLQVIDSDKGSTAASAVEKVGDKAQTLAKLLDKTSVANYAGPVSKLAGTIIRIYDENKREEILNKGITEGIPPAYAILELLKKDFTPQDEKDIQGILKDELKQTITQKINQYDELLKSQVKLSQEEKKKPELIRARYKAIEEIIIANKSLNALNSVLVIDALDDLTIALDQLKNVVESNNNPNSFSVFQSKLTHFSNSSVLLLDAVNAVKTAGEMQSK